VGHLPDISRRRRGAMQCSHSRASAGPLALVVHRPTGGRNPSLAMAVLLSTAINCRRPRLPALMLVVGSRCQHCTYPAAAN